MIFSIVSICSLIAITNNLLNQFILRNHYPDKELPKPLRVIHNIVSIFYALYLVLLFRQIISFTNEIKNFSDQGTEFLIFFYCLVLFLIMGIVLLVMQAGLKPEIVRSYNNKIAETINHIGNNSEQ